MSRSNAIKEDRCSPSWVLLTTSNRPRYGESWRSEALSLDENLVYHLKEVLGPEWLFESAIYSQLFCDPQIIRCRSVTSTRDGNDFRSRILLLEGFDSLNSAHLRHDHIRDNQ